MPAGWPAGWPRPGICARRSAPVPPPPTAGSMARATACPAWSWTCTASLPSSRPTSRASRRWYPGWPMPSMPTPNCRASSGGRPRASSSPSGGGCRPAISRSRNTACSSTPTSLRGKRPASTLTSGRTAAPSPPGAGARRSSTVSATWAPFPCTPCAPAQRPSWPVTRPPAPSRLRSATWPSTTLTRPGRRS